jgi:3-deoxy-D-manno-octulosonic-acid transferase
VLIASARVSDRTQRRYARLRGLLSAEALRNLRVAAQSEADASRFIALGARRAQVQVAGNVKFDRDIDAGQRDRGATLRRRYGGERPVWVAGSTHPGEELAILRVHRQLCARTPTLLVLAPRHSRRFGDVAEALQLQGWRWQRRSAAAADADRERSCEVLLLDTIGELVDFYAAADLAFVGGSLVPVGGHNLLEPVALGVATLTGPHQFNSPDIARALVGHGAVRIVKDASELAEATLALMADGTARAALADGGLAAMRDNRGALGRVHELAMALVAANTASNARRADRI